MHPIERLRFVARAGDLAPDELAAESAAALGALVGDARALLPACRRLLQAHPASGPLWWVCARVLCAADPARAADDAEVELLEDQTEDELAGSLPAGAIVAATVTETLIEGLAARPDCSVRLVGTQAALRRGVRSLGHQVADVACYGDDEDGAADAAEDATVVLVEALAASPTQVLVTGPASLLVEAAVAAGDPCWLVAPTGTVLPPTLFDACAVQATATGRDLAVVDAAAFALTVTPGGPVPTSEALAAATCPAPSELTRPAR